MPAVPEDKQQVRRERAEELQATEKATTMRSQQANSRLGLPVGNR